MDEANLLEKWFVARMIKIDLKEKSSIGFLMSLAMVGVKAGWLVVMRLILDLQAVLACRAWQMQTLGR